MTSKPVKNVEVRDGKLVRVVKYPSVSARIRAKKSKRVRPVRRTV